MTVNRLVALDMPASVEFADHVRSAWDAGDAVFPIDQRLPQTAKVSLVEQFKPSVLIDRTGSVINLSDSEPTEEGDALVIATSGSTGSPKGVIHTLDSIRALLNMSQLRLQTDSSTHWLLCLPVSHVAGFSILARSVLMGNQISIFAKFDEAEVMNAARAGATHVSLVPTAMQRIDPSVFETILLGGAAAPPNLPNNVVTTYGMTETFGGIAYNGLPLDGVEVRIVNESIELKSPSLFRTYRGNDAERRTSDWYETGDKGAYETGDKGAFANNLIRVFGRKDDMIITGGENVWPNAVEKVVATLPGVEQVVIGGIEDEQWGQRVVAWIVSSRDVAPTLENIRQYVKTQLPSFCAPTELRVVKEFPMTSLGKIDIQKLRKSK
jgi:O-succinylbenzoic acid--CoA ligase